MNLYIVDKTLDRFPFQTLENPDPIPNIKVVHIANKENEAILAVWGELSYGESLDSLDGFLSTRNREQITKKDIISFVYSPDQEAKILRDAAAGRNMDNFNEYDTFVESIPSV